MDEYIKKSEAIKAIRENPSRMAMYTARAICAIENLPTADVVPKSEVESIIILNSQLEAKVFDTRKEADILKSTVTHKEEEAYNKGYNDALKDVEKMITKYFGA